MQRAALRGTDRVPMDSSQDKAAGEDGVKSLKVSESHFRKTATIKRYAKKISSTELQNISLINARKQFKLNEKEIKRIMNKKEGGKRTQIFI